ncbi:CHAT domain-containing protein [Sunxiuqinia sp. A32]|uniref:CHAT domain-containing protein n=1 Tax=Sunxiuqinia sp. A32 TaxID=3461496 RepID=UPI0040458A12
MKKRLLGVVVFFVFFLKFFFSYGVSDETSTFNRDSLQSLEYNRKGVQAFRKGDFEESISSFNKSLFYTTKIFGENSTQIVTPLINLGIPLKNLGEYDKAIENYLKAESILISNFSENYPRLGLVYTNLGTVYKLQGDYVKSNEFQRAALRVLKNDSIRYESQIENVTYNIAEGLFLLNQYDRAIQSCKKNIEFVDDEVKSFYYSLLARIYNEMNELELADEYYQKTLNILKKIKGDDHYELGLEYVNYSSFLLSIGDFKDAFEYNELSAGILEKYFTKKSLQYSDVMINYADYYFSRNSEAAGIQDFNSKKREDLLTAMEYYQEAIISATENFESRNINENPAINLAISEIQLLKIMKKKAHSFEVLADLDLSGANKEEALNNYLSALESISLATELVHQIRTGFVSEDSKFFLAENQDATFIEAVNITYKLFQLTGDQAYAEKGFEFAEKSKSASFLAAARDSKAKEFGGIPDSLLNREDYFKINISNYREMLFEENQNDDPDSAQIAFYNSKIFQLSEQYQQLVQLFEDSFPNYYSFKYLNEVVDVEEVRMGLSEKEALVEFLIGEPIDRDDKGQIFRFVITKDDINFITNNVDYGFVEDIEYLYSFLASPNYLYTGLNDYKGYVKSAYNLYSELIKPQAEVFEGKQLIVVPDDKLSYIPFDAMLSSLSDTTKLNFRNLPYLVNDYSISYTYSATLLFNYFENDKQASKDLLAFAPSYTSSGSSDSVRTSLLPIPGIDKEVASIGDFLSADVFRDSMALEGEFKKLAPEYDILHLAMHTIINDTLPMFSKLAFSSPHSGDSEDGWLNTNEIYTMDLKARMAVLSACNTGSGKLQKGEGVMSLARGFLYAGCPSIVMTLWEVEDESGAQIMHDFYRLISKGKGKNEALRLAKLAHIKKADPLKAHPHYWLGYVAVGNPDPLYFGKEIYFILVIIGLVILFIVDQFYRKNKARRKPGF